MITTETGGMAVRTSTEQMPATFALLCFNQEAYVASAVRSALAQDHSPLEILISDDASDDRTWEIICNEVRRYAGPHSIRLHRNRVNLGCTGHTLMALELAANDLVVIGAGDDISEPNRTRLIAEAAAADRQSTSFWSDMWLMDADGKDLGRIDGYFRHSATIFEMTDMGAAPAGASQAYRKAVARQFGPVDRRAASEDLVLHFRSALIGTVTKVPGSLVHWRRHVASMESMNPLMKSVAADKFRDAVMRICEQRIFCFRTRLIDLQALAERCPERRRELAHLEQTTRRLVRRFEAMHGMARGGPVMAIANVIGALRYGADLPAVVRNLLMVRHPALWQRYTRWRAGMHL